MHAPTSTTTSLVLAAILTAVAAPALASPDATLTHHSSSSGVRQIGLMADVGVPDGAAVSLVYRPVRALRLHAGGSYNMISRGVRGGLTLVPFAGWFSPTLSVEYGHYAEGDANPLARMISGDETTSVPALQRVGYDYGNAHVGLEFGRKWATFYLHAGMSRVTGKVHGLDATSDDGMTSVTFTQAPDVELWSVSAKVGLIIYIMQ